VVDAERAESSLDLAAAVTHAVATAEVVRLHRTPPGIAGPGTIGAIPPSDAPSAP
jgi:hypothetical protein